MSIKRNMVGSLVLSAAALVGLVASEGYEPVARPPVPGDAPTLGFGSTGADIKAGDKTDPVKALIRAQRDIEQFEGALKRCVKVPLSQGEYDSLTMLAYNIGPTAFCNSTLVKLANQQDYLGMCMAILDWDKFKGKPLKGLTLRRQREFKQCMGDAT